ncbi:MAG: metallophosphoesterase [Nanoarchaeota archaeon]
MSKSKKPFKLLAAGDFHGDKSTAKKLAELAEKENVDLVILNGDLVEEQDTSGIIGPFLAKKRKVIILPGNHETIATADFLAELYNITNLHGYYMKIGDIGFFGCGGANVGLSQLSEEEIYQTLKKGFEKIKDMPKKIMVTHVHPADTKMEMFSKFVKGSKGLRKAIDKFKPDILICGHVHEAEGIEEIVGKTRVLNVGKKGKIINL